MPSLVIANIFPENGTTGIHTHIRELRQYFDECGIATTVVTPFSWGRLLRYPVFGLRRLVVGRISRAAGVVWYQHWHEVFLRKALRRCLVQTGDCVIYAQGPLEARAALHARRDTKQRVIMAVHFRISQADEAADGKEIRRDGMVFRAIRRGNRDVILKVDSLVYVSQWGRKALLSWCPEAAEVPYAVIGNFMAPLHVESGQEPLGDLVTTGRLELAKNQRFLLEVLAEAKRAGRSFTLDVFGDGPLRKDLVS
jgi:glycosyltransferase involved in cell wall biosynthesis